jgi:hypothetical protein
MKKILFNDECMLTDSTLKGIKNRTMRECKFQRPSEDYEIIVPVFDDDFELSPLAYAFGWRNNKTGDYTKWNVPKHKVGEVAAIAQYYRDVLNEHSSSELCDIILDDNGEPYPKYKSGYTNKMFVESVLMPHHIKITNIKIQRPQSLTDEEIMREGILKYVYDDSRGDKHIDYSYSFKAKGHPTAKEAFKELLSKTCGKDFYERNPFCFVYSYELID